MEKLVYVYWGVVLTRWALIIGAIVLATMLATGYLDIQVRVTPPTPTPE